MSGHVRQRGKKGHWYGVIDVFDGGKRKRRWHKLENCSGKREAEKACARLIAQQVDGTKMTAAEFVRERINQWEDAGNITPRTAQRYRQLAENQIVPQLGTKPLQKISRLDIEEWHTTLRNGGLAPRTIGRAHRLLGTALGDAERDGLIIKNVCKLQRAPKVAESEMVIVQDVSDFVSRLREAAGRLYTPAIVALFTGLRLGEVLVSESIALTLIRA
jgi:integrase